MDLGPRGGAEPRRRGLQGEDVAARHLLSEGWTVLDRNARLGPLEIDLVVRRGPVLAFVEVKTSVGRSGDHPFRRITPLKRRALERAAARWLRESRHRPREVRFDAVAVTLRPDGSASVEVLEDAWRPGFP